jgi:hypothetical protein
MPVGIMTMLLDLCPVAAYTVSRWQSKKYRDALELARRCSKEQELSAENSNMYTMYSARAY